jgi:hypothetical protein
MAQLTISIPDDLRENLDYRIHVSAICAKALREEVSRLTRRDDDIETAAHLLRRLHEHLTVKEAPLSEEEWQEAERIMDIYERDNGPSRIEAE